MSDEKETRFNVTKAELDLKSGESLAEFQRGLCDAVIKRVRDHFALGEKSWIYVADVFGDAAVAQVSGDGFDRRGLYQVTWVRKNNGFDIGEPVEVVRRVAYVPKTKTAVTKSLWSGVV